MNVESPNQTVVLNEQAREPVAQLCANIYLTGAGRGPAILAVASADHGEGRSSLALALGLQIMSSLGSPALVVEANLRSPGLGRPMNLPPNIPGVASLLKNGADPKEAIYKLGPNAPDVIPAGKAEPDEIGKLMNLEKMDKLFKTLAQRYPYLVIETPPINYYPETKLIITLADGVILTVKAGVTSRETAMLATRKIESINGKFLGVVLNQKRFHLPEWLYKRL